METTNSGPIKKQDSPQRKIKARQQKTIMSPLWRKTNKYFIFRFCKIFRINPLVFASQDSDGYKEFSSYCLDTLIHSTDLTIPEGMAFMYLLEGKSSQDALNKYNQDTSRSVEFATLHKHAKQACNKVIKYLESNETTKKEIERKFKNVIEKK